MPAFTAFGAAPSTTSTQPAAASTASNIFKAAQPTTFGSILNQQEDDESGGQNPEEYEPEVDFKPIVQLKEVEVKTGEEDEEVLFKQRCKLFKFDSEKKEWKEKGVGELKLLKHKQSQAIRVLMRRDQVLKLCANHKIGPEMKLTEMGPKQLSWLAMDFSEQTEPKTEMLLAKFRNNEEAAQFKTEFEKAAVASKSLEKSSPMKKSESAKITSDKPSLSQTLKSDNWNCTACYAPNKKDMVKCACCGSAKPGITSSFTSPSISASTGQDKPAVTESKSQTFSFGTMGAANNQTQGKLNCSFN